MRLAKLTLILGVVCLCALGCTEKTYTDIAFEKTVPSSNFDYSGLTAENHPRVIYTDEDFASIAAIYNAGTNTYLNVMYDAIFAQADAAVGADDLVYNTSNSAFYTICETAEQRMLSCAFAYRMTGEERYLEQVEHDISTVCNFQDWYAYGSNLETGEMTAGVGLVYDWLYNYLSDDVKTLAKEKLIEFSLQPALDGEVHSSPWTVYNNWNAVCNGGLVSAALAIYEEDPTVCYKVIKKGVAANVQGQEYGYSPDGIYPEGPTYWDYGTSYEAILLTALETCLGEDNGLSEIEGFSKTGQYMVHMYGPSGYSFNYADSGITIYGDMAPWFLAWRFNDLSVLYVEKDKMSTCGSCDQARLLPIFIWYASKLNVSGISAPADNIFYGDGTAPIVLVHDTWTMDENDQFLGIKGGYGGSAHGHLDVGSFVYEAESLRWAADLGKEDYTPLEANLDDIWNYDDGSDRWTVFRYNNFNHNTITVNNAYHKAAGVGEFTEIIDSNGRKGASIDLSDVLGFDEVYSAYRSIYIEGSDLVVEDEITALVNKDAEIRWTMVTQATPTLSDKYVTLDYNGKTRYLNCISTDADIEWQTWSTDSGHDWERSNAGYYECGYTTVIEAGNTAKITVRLTPTNAVN